MAQLAGNVMSIDQIVAELEELQSKLDPDDGVAVFNKAYLTVTQAISAKLGTDGYFDNPATLRQLDARFAGQYLAAGAANGQPPVACWRALIDLRENPQAAVRTCRHCRPRRTRPPARGGRDVPSARHPAGRSRA